MQLRLIIILAILTIQYPVVAQTQSAGLVAHYKFDNNYEDYSGQKNHGNKMGKIESIADRFGNPCGAIRINGIDGFITVPNSPSLRSVNSPFTISFWVKPEIAKPNQLDLTLPILTKGTSANESQFCFHQSSPFGEEVSKITLSSKHTAENTKFNQNPIDFDQWYFLAVVVEDGWAYGYVNNKMAWQSLFKGDLTPNDLSLVIGRVNAGGMKYFTGCLDDLRIYNRALNGNEISQLYNDQSGKDVSEKITIKPLNNVELTAPPGECSIPYQYNLPEVEAACGTYKAVLTEGLPSGSAFAVGVHKLSFEVTTNGGNKSTSSFTITVKDTEPPVITCPQNFITKIPPDRYSTGLELPTAIASDNCSVVKIDNQPMNVKNGLFPLGVTNVIATATDASGNTSKCKYSVMVEHDLKADNNPKPATKSSEIEKNATAKPPVKKTNASEASTVKAPSTPKPVTKDTLSDVSRKPTDNKPEKTLTATKKNVREKIPVEKILATPLALPDRTKPDIQPFRLKTTLTPISSFTTANAISSKHEGIQPEKINVEMPAVVKPKTTNDPLTSKPEIVETKDAKETPTNSTPQFYCPSDTFITLPGGRKGVTFRYEEPKLSRFNGFDTIIQTAGSKSGCFLTLGEHEFSFVAKTKKGAEQRCGFKVTVTADEAPLVFDLPQKVEILALGNDSINYQHKANFSACKLTAVIYDDGENDNDMVSIIFNGQVIFDHVVIKTKQKGAYTKVLSLNPNGKNYLVAKAWNTGELGLNTLRIDFYDGSLENEKQDLKNRKPTLTKVLHSKPGVAGGIQLTCH